MKNSLRTGKSRTNSDHSTTGRWVGGAEVHRSNSPTSLRLSRSTLGAAAVASALSALYFIFVLHYSVNLIYFDEWQLVPLIHAALHSNLTFSALWQQHYENRLFVPNLFFVASGLVTNDNTKVVILFSALVFIASFILTLAVFRLYLGRSPGPVQTLTLGIAWFSLEDTQNSLWGFQFAWYLIVLFLVIMLFVLAKKWRHPNIALAVAALTAVAASFSSLQGLILWPVGLICLLWERPRGRRVYIESGSWLLLAAIATTVYFLGYRFGDSFSFALHHPVGTVKFFLAAVGNVVLTTGNVPNAHTDLRAHELIGLALCITAAFVIICSLHNRTIRTQIPFPVALIAFGLMFDGLLTPGRLNSGISYALSTRYTMANLLILTGIVAFAWEYAQVSRDVWETVRRVGTACRVGFLVLAVFLVAQFASTTTFGIVSARGIHWSRTIGARTLVNLDRLPSSEATPLILNNVYWSYSPIFSLVSLRPLLREAEKDHLSVFAPGPFAFYRQMGPP
jgi:uncharacterized membrane protein (UPF0136 family)